MVFRKENVIFQENINYLAAIEESEILKDLNAVRSLKKEKSVELLKKLGKDNEIELWKTTAKSLISRGDWCGYQEYRTSVHWGSHYLVWKLKEVEETEKSLIEKSRSLIGVEGKKEELVKTRKNIRERNIQKFKIKRKLILLNKTQLELREHSDKRVNNQFHERFSFNNAIVFENKNIINQKTKQVSIDQIPTFIETFPAQPISNAESNM
jgi:hypothetical protein